MTRTTGKETTFPTTVGVRGSSFENPCPLVCETEANRVPREGSARREREGDPRRMGLQVWWPLRRRWNPCRPGYTPTTLDSSTIPYRRPLDHYTSVLPTLKDPSCLLVLLRVSYTANGDVESRPLSHSLKCVRPSDHVTGVI